MTQCELPGIPKLASGKVREIFDLGDSLLFVATDRISAYDCILGQPIPRKGEVLNKISEFWFEKMDFAPNHLITTNPAHFPDSLAPFRDLLAGRSMIVKKATPLPVECVVRGYLAGSGFAEYEATGKTGGYDLPAGLRLADPLPEPLFTPARKAQTGHDENITFAHCRSMVGDALAHQLRDLSIEIYEHGRAYAAQRGIIIADTKFEFGLIDGDLVLIDEILTPDSSRFWPAETYEAGKNPPSFDKQFVRDYLSAQPWDKTPPPPALPPHIIERTSAKYLEAYEGLTGLQL